METIKTLTNGNRKAVIKITNENYYFLMCTIDGRASICFPAKSYITQSGAERAANKFLNS